MANNNNLYLTQEKLKRRLEHLENLRDSDSISKSNTDYGRGFDKGFHVMLKDEIEFLKEVLGGMGGTK